MKIQPFFILFAALLASCHITSQTTTVQAKPKYTFKKVDDLPSVSPCLRCVMTNAKKKYRRGNISFPACVSGTYDKRYLKLSISKGSTEQKLVMVRDCGDAVTVTFIGFCENTGPCDFDSVINLEAQTFNCNGQAVLTLKMNSSSVSVLSLAAGWDLYYETVICPEN